MVLGGVFLAFMWFQGHKPSTKGLETQSYPEIQELSKSQKNFSELTDYFQDIAKNKGGRYAFDILRLAPIPPNIDIHLLGHAIGDILYQQEGAGGMTACTNDFRNACSHSIVVGLFFDEGEEALETISQVCRQAPGGTGAYTMCFHGLGHGILAYADYDMQKAAEICNRAGTKEYNYRENSECIGGTVMEIIGGGFHDKELWAKQRVKYLDAKQPTSLCYKPFIPENARYMCFVYLTPFMFEAVGADLGRPGPEEFTKSFKFCESEAGAMRDACFGGFGKEFIVLAQDRDIRQSQFEKTTDEQLARVYDWCKLASIKEGTAACINHAASSLYWGGENNRSVAIRFCGLMQDNEYFQGSCVHNMIQSVAVYISDQSYRRQFCGEIPEKYSDECLNLLIK